MLLNHSSSRSLSSQTDVVTLSSDFNLVCRYLHFSCRLSLLYTGNALGQNNLCFRVKYFMIGEESEKKDIDEETALDSDPRFAENAVHCFIAEVLFCHFLAFV